MDDEASGAADAPTHTDGTARADRHDRTDLPPGDAGDPGSQTPGDPQPQPPDGARIRKEDVPPPAETDSASGPAQSPSAPEPATPPPGDAAPQGRAARDPRIPHSAATAPHPPQSAAHAPPPAGQEPPHPAYSQAPAHPGQHTPAGPATGSAPPPATQFAPVPAYAQQPQFPAMPASPAEWRYHPPKAPSWWHRHRRTVRALLLITLLALCGLTILGLVRQQTGTLGLLVGLGLAVLPVPLLVAAFRWIDGVEPTPWRNHLFAFAWGACAATLVALLANSFATDWLTTSIAASSGQADMLGAAVIAPVVEETAKGTAVLLLFCFRRRDFDGVTSGLALAGITATGFAFTENVLYLGTAFGEDQLLSPDELHESVTAMTFFIRIVLAPFAHPLFTAFIGIGFGIIAALPSMRRSRKLPMPVLGWLTAVLLHGIWNASASLPDLTFIGVYALFMIPVFATLTWLAVWSRRQNLHTVRDTLPAYAAAGWFHTAEPWGLASMRARSLARSLARRNHGPGGARTVTEYQHFATTLALLRARALHGTPPPDFHAREQELLHHLWQRHALAGAVTVSTAFQFNPLLDARSWHHPQPGGPYGPLHTPVR